jgi:hypothetical protein
LGLPDVDTQLKAMKRRFTLRAPLWALMKSLVGVRDVVQHTLAPVAEGRQRAHVSV